MRIFVPVVHVGSMQQFVRFLQTRQIQDIVVIYALRLSSLLLVALALVPAGAHMFAMANKLHLDRSQYLIAQRP